MCVCAVCGTPDLPAGAVIYLVWEPGRLERQQDGLQAVCLRGYLSHHAPPLPRLLDRTQVKGHITRKCHRETFYKEKEDEYVRVLALTDRRLLCFHQVGKILKIPVIKFLLHSASYLWFLITLLGESITMEMYRDKFASRQQNILHSSFHMVWVVGGFTLSFLLLLRPRATFVVWQIKRSSLKQGCHFVLKNDEDLDQGGRLISILWWSLKHLLSCILVNFL